MYSFNQLRRDTSQLELDLNDLVRNVDRMFPYRSDISRDLRSMSDRIRDIGREFMIANRGIQND